MTITTPLPRRDISQSGVFVSGADLPKEREVAYLKESEASVRSTLPGQHQHAVPASQEGATRYVPNHQNVYHGRSQV